jgi:uncharacterized cupredoxin-like copper-binding protein
VHPLIVIAITRAIKKLACPASAQQPCIDAAVPTAFGLTVAIITAAATTSLALSKLTDGGTIKPHNCFNDWLEQCTRFHYPTVTAPGHYQLAFNKPWHFETPIQ